MTNMSNQIMTAAVNDGIFSTGMTGIRITMQDREDTVPKKCSSQSFLTLSQMRLAEKDIKICPVHLCPTQKHLDLERATYVEQYVSTHNISI